MDIQITRSLSISEDELEVTAIRSQGPGGQNVNKTSSAAQVRFDIGASSLPESRKAQLRSLRDHRITGSGDVIIKAQRFRSFERNRDDAIERLSALLQKAFTPQKKRKPTKPTKAAKERRLKAKTKRKDIKQKRGKVRPE